ncbi:putative flagellar outer dynein arm-docking complex protein 1 [Paratrimastix pyriformis]|uniref:Flagellar outer dynein arm-docking complex protein 1 n=1 Tax=Paratrimastix pyriformis TaxID=342808 RepID=A0ABQ8UVE0_9EUKA|nr:putative flagellar outer dynein arm-docking complex protein 1 [Paratrimastix pyriformis]
MNVMEHHSLRALACDCAPRTQGIRASLPFESAFGLCFFSRHRSTSQMLPPSSAGSNRKPAEGTVLPLNAAASVRSIEQTVMREKEKHQKLLRSQHQTIERLRQENETLKEKLEIESRAPRSSGASSLPSDIQDLEHNVDGLARRIAGFRDELDQKDKELAILTSKISAKRVEVGGVYSARDADMVISKQIHIIENRLEKALVKFNEAIAYNKELREQIDNLRCERVIFDGIYKKTERDLYERKKEMARIIEDSNLAYEERNASIEEIRMLQEQQKENEEQYQKEMERLEKEIAHLQSTQPHPEEAPSETGAASGLPIPSPHGSRADERSRSKPTPDAWASMKQRTVQQLSNEKVQSYEDALKQIQTATKITDITELVAPPPPTSRTPATRSARLAAHLWGRAQITHFTEIEDLNVSNANMIGDLEIEIQRVRSRTKELRAEEEARRTQYSTTNEECRKRTAALLERLQATEARRDEYLARTKDAYQWAAPSPSYSPRHPSCLPFCRYWRGCGWGGVQVEAITEPIMQLFQGIECRMPAGELGPTAITRENIMRFLGLIEQHVSELVAPYVVLHPESRHLLGNDDDDDLADIDVPLIGQELRATAITLASRVATSSVGRTRTPPSRSRRDSRPASVSSHAASTARRGSIAPGARPF